MPPSGQFKTPVPAPKPKAVSPVRSSGIVLPTEKTKPNLSIKDYIVCIFGAPGIGKTTFFNAIADRVLFISTDGGTKFIDSMRVQIRNWDDFLSVVDLLEKGGASQYDMVVVDHLGDWASFAEMYTCELLKIGALADAPYGKGWSTYKKTLHYAIIKLKALGIGLGFIAHEVTKVIKIEGVEVHRCMPSMTKQAWDHIIPLVDVVGHASMKPMKDAATGKRIEVRTLTTTPRRDLFAKDRSPNRKRPTDRDWELLDGRKFAESFQG